MCQVVSGPVRHAGRSPVHRSNQVLTSYTVVKPRRADRFIQRVPTPLRRTENLSDAPGFSHPTNVGIDPPSSGRASTVTNPGASVRRMKCSQLMESLTDHSHTQSELSCSNDTTIDCPATTFGTLRTRRFLTTVLPGGHASDCHVVL